MEYQPQRSGYSGWGWFWIVIAILILFGLVWWWAWPWGWGGYEAPPSGSGPENQPPPKETTYAPQHSECDILQVLVG